MNYSQKNLCHTAVSSHCRNKTNLIFDYIMGDTCKFSQCQCQDKRTKEESVPSLPNHIYSTSNSHYGTTSGGHKPHYNSVSMLFQQLLDRKLQINDRKNELLWIHLFSKGNNFHVFYISGISLRLYFPIFSITSTKAKLNKLFHCVLIFMVLWCQRK